MQLERSLALLVLAPPLGWRSPHRWPEGPPVWRHRQAPPGGHHPGAEGDRSQPLARVGPREGVPGQGHADEALHEGASGGGPEPGDRRPEGEEAENGRGASLLQNCIMFSVGCLTAKTASIGAFQTVEET